MDATDARLLMWWRRVATSKDLIASRRKHLVFCRAMFAPDGTSDGMRTSGHPPTATDETIRVLKDSNCWIQRTRELHSEATLVLLTPALAPTETSSQISGDPFEPLGQAIAQKHAKVRHVPYLEACGLTSTHVGFIKRGNLTILCLSFPANEPITLSHAEMAFAVGDGRPCLLLLVHVPALSQPDGLADESIRRRIADRRELQRLLDAFPTVIEVAGCSPSIFHATTAALFERVMGTLIPPRVA